MVSRELITEQVDPQELAENNTGKFHSYSEAIELVRKASGIVHKLPRGIEKLEWKVEIGGKFGLKYINPDNSSEWIQVLPSLSHPNWQFSEFTTVRYHLPSNKMISKLGEKHELEKLEKFDQNNLEHIKLIDTYLHGNPNDILNKKASEISTVLSNFWITLDDLFFIRNRVGYLTDSEKKRNKGKTEDFDKLIKETNQVLDKLKRCLLCDCFIPFVSKSKLGILYRYCLSSHFHVRLGFHLNYAPFVMVTLHGQHHDHLGNTENQSGESYDGSSGPAHIFFEKFIKNFDWLSIEHRPGCQRVIAFADFEYNEMKKAAENFEKKLNDPDSRSNEITSLGLIDKEYMDRINYAKR